MRDAGKRLQVPMQEPDRDVHVHLSTWLPEDRNGGRMQGYQRMCDQFWSLPARSLRQSRRQLPMPLLRWFRAKLGWEVVYRYGGIGIRLHNEQESWSTIGINVYSVSMASDRRVGYCFLQTIGGRCTARTLELRTVTKADCCCTMGAAWGPHCEICPTRDSDNYNELCLDKGFSVNGQGIEFSEMTVRLLIPFAIS